VARALYRRPLTAIDELEVVDAKWRAIFPKPIESLRSRERNVQGFRFFLES
jgi:hypothetical protein